ncbi:TonB-dependent receptor plug domain-containing protein [Rapidithrix thailandica]|uniref:TonB-dependent receptor plug domain-containing protein n=1 Tax=Rapidithrix thailandica TaxID=413964 RepID=A0AAW9SDM0_9BACT
MKITAILFICLLNSILLSAQHQSSITGQVLDALKNPIISAHIKIKNTDIVGVTGINGFFNLDNIPEGVYEIEASSIGFIAQQQEVKLEKNQRVQLNFILQENVHQLDDITIVSQSVKSQKEEAAQAITVIDTKDVSIKTGDLGEMMAGVQGISVRRSGGLGDKTSFSLNGLSGNQIRFFLDGIPLEFHGYTFGISTVPTNLVDHIEVYKGVVPIKFGADALGGAVNIISPEVTSKLGGFASYQTGSFGTQRTSLYVKKLNEDTGVFFDVNGFYDYAKNNYKVEVEVPDDKGKLREVTVPRFHDAYKGQGASITFGVQNKPWVKELSIKGYFTDYTKEIQHNYLMEGIPYGEVMSYRKSAGTLLKYRNDFGTRIALDAAMGYNYRERQFTDVADCTYNWFGECIAKRNVPGEIPTLSSANQASNLFTWNYNLFARITADWKLAENHSISITLAPTHTRQTGDDKMLNSFDPFDVQRTVLTWVNGIEYNAGLFESKLENTFFVKNYLQHIASEQLTPPNDELTITERTVNYFGFGNGLHYKLSRQFSTKLTYEYATRLPQPDELFGDGLTLGNLDLKPESSHNVNLEFSLKNKYPASRWLIRSNIFLRKIENLILLVPGEVRTSYQNVFEATSTGIEIAAKWTSKNDKLSLAANSTYQNYYNNSEEGLFKTFHGDRIPNIPYFFANVSGTYALRNLLKNNDKLSFFWSTRHVHKFFRSWESGGLNKQGIPSQQVHNAGTTYQNKFASIRYDLTIEVQNLTNNKNFDFYGVQKPGRAVYVKLLFQI